MQLENKIWQEDLEQLINSDWIPWSRLEHKTILVTGANGLIGSSLVRGLAYADRKLNLNMRILALVRDKDRAMDKFSDIKMHTDLDWKTPTDTGLNLASETHRSGSRTDGIFIICGDVEHELNLHEKVNFIIHGASPTASSYFVEKPVETIRTAVCGTINMLELAKADKVEGFVYLSSMEIYGAPQSEQLLSEKDIGYMNPLIVRNCYPESKRMCENLCASYADEYNVPAMNIRLAQTFGPGVEKGDTRVFAEFAECMQNKKDIVLLTSGGSKRCYLYTMDAVSAVLTVLLKGKRGSAYNAGNSDTYCSIKEMAQMVAHELADDAITVKFLENSANCKKFSPHHFFNLDMAAISRLGWKPTWGLKEMYVRMMDS